MVIFSLLFFKPFPERIFIKSFFHHKKFPENCNSAFAFCYTALWTKAFIFARRLPLTDAVVKNIFFRGEAGKKNAEKYEGGNEMNAEGLTFQ